MWIQYILKKYLHSIHCKFYIFALWFYGHSFPNFARYLSWTTYLFYELLVMEQTLVAISPSCNLHALPDYILFCNLCPICCRQNCYSTCKNHNACKDFCDFAEKKRKNMVCIGILCRYSAIVFFTVHYNFHQNFPFCKKWTNVLGLCLNFAGINNLCFYEVFLWDIYET